jgi:hypothetical protein
VSLDTAETSRRACARKGCSRTISATSRYDTCCVSCRAVHVELDEAARVFAATADDAHWSAATALIDAVDAYQSSDRRIFLAAREAGFTAQQWREIKRGTA